MPIPLFNRTPHDTICALYGVIVAQARRPAFYLSYGVPDTVTGRFELVVLHAALLLRRLAGEPGTQNLAQGLFDEFCRDMDHNLREMGVGDTAVPREMKRMGEAFFGRRNAYEAALVSGRKSAAAAALRRNLYAGEETAPADCMAAYVHAAALNLASQDIALITKGRLSFPNPERFQE
jgi:cytochrome b pre-mRNA-processing protein 3